VSIPLNGQGNPLPPNFPYRGEWILEPRMFLYVPDQAESTTSNAPRFTASLNDNRDDWCFGFDSEQLAAALNITTDSLFQANRHRKLTLENVEASTPDGEMCRHTPPGAPSGALKLGRRNGPSSALGAGPRSIKFAGTSPAKSSNARRLATKHLGA
jgi:hypothetical protein